MSKKNRAEWNILINSTNTKALNILGLTTFSVNAFLYTLLGVRYSFTEDKINWYIISSFCWLSCCFVFFFRLFYNREANCLAKTLPNAKKLYTKKLPTIFCLMNFSIEFLLGIVYLISYLREKINPIFLIIFLIYCCFNFFLSLELKIIIKITSQEKTMSVWGSGLTKEACKLIGTIFGTIGILAVITFSLSHFRQIIIPFLEENITIFAVLCIGLLIASWIVSFRYFNKLYNKR